MTGPTIGGIPSPEYRFTPTLCAAFDLEVFPNRWECGFLWFDSKGVLKFVVVDGDVERLRAALDYFSRAGYTLVGFNIDEYDIPIVRGLFAGEDPFEVTRVLIDGKPKPWEKKEPWQIRQCQVPFRWRNGRDPWPEFPCDDHIDLRPRVDCGLKVLAARLGRPHLQELPFPPKSVINDDQWEIVKAYNRKDCDNTLAVLESFTPQIQALTSLSNEWNLDLRSLRDGGVCEAVFKEAYRREYGVEVTKSPIPEDVWYEPVRGVRRPGNPEAAGWYDEVTSHPFPVVMKRDRWGRDRPDVKVPDLEVRQGDFIIRLGGGGIHGTHLPRGLRDGYVLNRKRKITWVVGTYIATRKVRIVGLDVSSFYPSMIVVNGIAPPLYGPVFPKLLGEFLHRREDVKRRICTLEDGDEKTSLKVLSDGLKIVNNSVFGRLKYTSSTFFDLASFIRVVISGQLLLVDLAERLQAVGCQILTANTDGVYLRMKRSNRRWEQVIEGWSSEVGVAFDREDVRRIAIRNVNEYAVLPAKGRTR